MNEDEILTELKAISSALKRKEREGNKILWIIAPLVCLFFLLMIVSVGKDIIIDQSKPARVLTWSDVDRLAIQGKTDKAISACKEMLARSPLNPAGHAKLAWYYLMNGDVTNSLISAKRAYSLNPTKENLDQLQAIEKRIESESPTKPLTVP